MAIDKRRLDTLREIKNAIRNKYAFPGGYRLIVTLEGEVFCTDCARKNFRELADNVRADRTVEVGVHWEGEPLHCDECNVAIESEYGPTPTDAEEF